MEEHLLTPATAEWLFSQERPLLTQIKVTGSAGMAERLHISGQAIRHMLQDNAIANIQMAYIVANLNHLTDHLMAGIKTPAIRAGSGRNTDITRPVELMQIPTTDARQTIAYADPTALWERLTWQVLNL
jgi:hypothetical protein